jgi:hypothetical protein
MPINNLKIQWCVLRAIAFDGALEETAALQCRLIANRLFFDRTPGLARSAGVSAPTQNLRTVQNRNGSKIVLLPILAATKSRPEFRHDGHLTRTLASGANSSP